MVEAYTRSQLDYLRTTFTELNKKPHQPQKFYPHLTPSSVLVPLTIKNGIIHVLLTVRSKDTLSHKGQVAFPGGLKSEVDTSSVDTALREAHEEIGLSPKDVEVLSVLPMTFAVPRFSVVPVVGLIPSDFLPVVDEKEVETAFSVPLIQFLNISNCRTEIHSYYGIGLYAYFFKLNTGSKYVWCYGLTAYLCQVIAHMVFETSSCPKLLTHTHSSSSSDIYEFYHIISEQSFLKAPVNFHISKL